ncbi:hypothetical protein ACHWQZ_G005046 [Mnemiopsis leidyi]
MLGSVSCNKNNTSINLRSIYNNFVSSLNDGLLLHLPKNEELKDLANADSILDFLYSCWLVPELSYHVAFYCKSLCKVFVVRGRGEQANRAQYIHALGKTAAHTNISVECYKFLASKLKILNENMTKRETVTLHLGLSSIVENVPESKDLICKEDVLKFCQSTDSDIKRHAEHLLARCSDLNDDVFKNTTPVDYPGDYWKEGVCLQIDMDDSEPVFLDRLEEPLFCTGNKVLQVKHKESTEKAIVRTSNVDEAISQVGEAYDARKPVLLQGEIGSGKTLVLEHFASLFGLGQEEVLSVQLDEQTDSKVLIGNYVCSEVPGQYVWQPGVLTRAATSGKWIIFEDIDHAPSDVMSLIKSVTETHKILTPAASLTTHPNFTVFLTQRVTEAGIGYHHNPVLAMLDNTFCKVRLKFYNDSQLEQVISGKFPALAGCAKRLVELYNSLSNSTLRQLIKWSSRVQGHLTHNLTVVTKEVFLEAVDCFCSWQACPQKRNETAYKIGTFLSMPKSKVESYLNSYQPVISPSHTHYTVGRCTLQCHAPPLTAPLYAHTRSAAVLLEKLACAVQHREPVLLTGETGNGKTASVQQLAARTGNNLVVINMSQQSDAADLIGGFKPLDVIQLIKPLYTTFELLFKESFSVSKNANFLYKVQVCWRQKEWSTLLQAILHISSKMSSKRWRTLGEEANKINKQIEQIENSFAFSFIEGSLVQAVKKGEWVLLDEINLAPLEVLESLNCILDDTGFLVVESGNMDVVKKHPNFRLFAAMNPSTDVGKKELPVGIKNRFTEIYVDELTEETDLKTLTAAYLHHMSLPSAIINKIVSLYKELRRQAADVLTDGRGHKPCYSIRTLCRALKYIGKNPCGNTLRSLYEGFSLSFLTQLDRSSYPRVRQLIIQHLLPDNSAGDIIKHKLPQPSSNHVQVEGYWIEKGGKESVSTPGYILTATVRENLRDLARAVSSSEYPVLLQGPTSAGKTSVVKYLAGLAGTKVIRINNHEHTDLQEYVGSYCVGENDKLAFKEGLLVEAMRAGHWLILDELNLAPTDVLEALNRVLDDNRELFIPETQTTVKAHPHFMLFATQNPAGSYGGRKTLSRAFRNRFIELHYEDLPLPEIKTIIEERCQLPPSYSKKIMSVMEKLQSSRTKSGIFAGRHGLITLRDLFRWADRYRLSTDSGNTDWDQLLANDGYMLLTGKVRRREEEQTIKEVLVKVFKRQIDPATFLDGTLVSADFHSLTSTMGIVWTPSMMRLLTLVSRSLEFKEPVLLVGDTGCGKTTVCQVVSVLRCLKLHILNCHMHSDTADFIGSLRPVRDSSGDKLFEWVDGPLISAMKNGDMILLDEISLADDSVLERLNSVLEPERQITLAESSESLTLTAHHDFRVVATMNPGGDYGKKELSPALRNRFTEIWCSSGDSLAEMRQIVRHHLICEEREEISEKMVEFIGWFLERCSSKHVVSVRDALTWTTFLNKTSDLPTSLLQRYLHGAHLILVDSLSDPALKQLCTSYLHDQCGEQLTMSCDIHVTGQFVKFGTLSVRRGELGCADLEGYSIGGPTTAANVLRIARGLLVDKPILLEGHPGVGKTSLTSALAKLLGYRLTRINLSEQTDMSDLFGCDLPSEDGAGFSWRDGPLLKALKQGNWILLDEMNLASQAVLEGLNACLDHRGELYVPELSKTFTIGKSDNKSRFIACMNPVDQGGGRKGLPKSFLNRFVKVYVETLTKEDMMLVLTSTHPHIPREVLAQVLSFNWAIHQQVKELREKMFPNHNNTPATLLMDSNHFQIGPTLLPRLPSASVPTSPYVRNSQLRAMETLAQAVKMNWMSILVGPSNCGKSTTVKTFAAMCGRDILEIGCSSVFDISDLLGGFSQVSKSTYVQLLHELVKDLTRELINARHESLGAVLTACRGIQQGDEFGDGIRNLLRIFTTTAGDWPEKAIQIHEQISSVFYKLERSKDGMFEWKNSRFVDALVQGSWVLLDNANLVSPSVLDRLNPLLEKDGILVLDERGYVNGQAVVIKPHPDFRLFMTVDPRYGELSRPMRNRGVEIYVEREEITSSEDIGHLLNVSCLPRLLTHNSAAFNVNLYSQILRDPTEEFDHEEVIRTVLGYIPLPNWRLLLSLFSSGLTGNLLTSIKQLLESADIGNSLLPGDVRLNPWVSQDELLDKFYMKFLCSSYDLTSGKKGSALMDMACSLTRAEWEDHFVFRKFALFFKTFTERESGTLWWELREHLHHHPLSSVYDERYGASRDTTHSEMVRRVGHPPLVQSESLGMLIDHSLSEVEVFTSNDIEFLRKAFGESGPGLQDQLSLVSDSDTTHSDDQTTEGASGNEVRVVEGQEFLSGTYEVAKVLIDVLLCPTEITGEFKEKIMKAVFPHVSLYMRYSLQSYLKQQEHLSDVLAALMSLDVKLVASRKESTTKENIPSMSSYDGWTEKITETISNIIFNSLIEGSCLLNKAREWQFKTIETLIVKSHGAGEVTIDTLLKTMEKACSLDKSDPVEHYGKLHTSTLAFVKKLDEQWKIHSAIQLHSQGGVETCKSVYPFPEITRHKDEAEKMISEIAGKLGYRPKMPTYSDLSEELTTFDRVVCQRASKLSGHEVKIQSWMKSVGTFVSKAYTKYWHYRDALSPFIIILNCLYRTIRDSVEGTASKNEGRFDLFDRIDRLPQMLTSNILQGKKVATNLKLMDYLVKILNYKDSLSAFVSRKLNGQLLSLVKSYYLVWEQNNELRKKVEIDQESVYKDTERYQIDDNITADSIFPCFEDFNDLDPIAHDNTVHQPALKIKKEDEDILSIEEMAGYIQHMIDILLPKTNSSLEMIQQRLKAFLCDELEGSCHNRGDTLKISLQWSLLDRYSKNSKTLEDANKDDAKNEDSFKDIYRGSYPAEILSVRPLLQDLRGRVTRHLQTWPEHPALVQISTVVDRIQDFPLDQPIIKFLQGLEILLTKCQLWESVASKEVSMYDAVERLTQQIIRWRSIELRSWPLLLDEIHKKHVMRSNDNFLKLANLVMGSGELDTETHSSSFVSSVFSFIESSTVGEYSERLQYLRICLEKFSVEGRLRNVLQSVLSFFTLFEDLIKQELEKSTDAIKKELKDYVKIVRWKDVNYFSVKQSTEASHQKLVKFMKQYEDCLKQPANAVLEKDEILRIPPQSSIFSPLERGEMVTGLVRTIKETVSDLQDASEIAGKIDDKDKRLKALKGVDLRKRKALSDLFKCLSYCGLSFTKGIAGYFSANSLHSMMTEPNATPDSSWTVHSLKVLLKLVTNPSDQIGPTELDRIKGFSGHLLGVVMDTLKMRNMVRKHLSILEKLKSNLSYDELCNHQQIIKDRLTTLTEKAVPLQDCIHQALFIANAISGLNVETTSFSLLYDKDSLINKNLINELKEKVENFRKRLQKLVDAVDYKEHIFTSLDVSEVSDLERLADETLVALETLANKKQTILGNVPTTLPLFGKLETAVARIRAITVPPTAVRSSSIKQINTLLAALKVPQHKKRGILEAENWGCEKGVLINQLQEFEDSTNAADLEKTVSVLAEILVLARSHNPLPVKVLLRVKHVTSDLLDYSSKLDVKMTGWISNALFPLVDSLVRLFRDIIKRGYCKPAELEEAEREGGEMFDSSESGGVGEGQGTTDVSNQIDGEEQVEGTKNEEKEEQEDVKEEKEGLEMEEDFEGAIGDVEPGDKEDGGSGDDESEDPDGDEQMGDVDQPEDKQQSETFGESDEKLPDTEAEAEKGAKSEQQNEMVAKDDELEQDPESKEVDDQQQLEAEDEVEAEEYNAEDDIPDPDAPGQPADDIPPEAEELPDDMEGLEDGEEHEGADMEDIGEEVEDMEDSEEAGGEEEEGTATEEQEEQSEDANEDVEKVGASAPTHHSEAAPDPNAETQSTQGGAGAEEQASGKDEQNQGQSADPGGESTQTATEEMESGSDQRKRHRENEQKQLSEKTSAKRAKTLPKMNENHDSANAEVKETNVYEHTEEGEPYDKEVMDTTVSDGKEHIVHDEDDETGDNEMGTVMEDYGEEDKDEKTDKVTDKLTNKQNREELSKESEKEEAGDSEDAVKDMCEIEDSRVSYFSTDEAYKTSRPEVLEQIRSGLMEVSLSGRGDVTEKEATERWNQFESLTADLSQDLCEQLRLILEPTKAAKLKGDFRTGKRLNMKRIIPYIASKFQKDKIWLRRSKPSSRDYQVMIALDDSASMSSAECVQMSLEAVAVICGALSKLEIGRLGVCSFGTDTSLVVPFDEPFTGVSGARIVRHFAFQDSATDVIRLLELTRSHFAHSASLHSNQPVSQLLFIVSDGRGLFIKGVEAVKKAVKESWDAGVFMVFLIIDKQRGSESILDVRTPVFDSSGKLVKIESYLESFPFPYYVVLRDPIDLPATLADALRQWIEIVASSS